MALVDRIINAIKEIENYRFDKEVAELLDIDNKALATYKSRGELPQYYIKFFCRRYNIDLKNLDSFLSNIDNYNKNIIGIKQSGSVGKKEKDKEMEYTIIAQRETIELQKEKIKELRQKLKSGHRHISKPAYHFKMVSKYVEKTDSWLDTDIFGDFSMTGYTYDEIVPLMNEENDKDSWLDRYHPDSRKRLNSQTLKDVRTDYHYLKWEHMMWMAKDGQYKCYNIDLVYIRKEQKVTSMFYWVNGDTE